MKLNESSDQKRFHCNALQTWKTEQNQLKNMFFFPESPWKKSWLTNPGVFHSSCIMEPGAQCDQGSVFSGVYLCGSAHFPRETNPTSLATAVSLCWALTLIPRYIKATCEGYFKEESFWNFTVGEYQVHNLSYGAISLPSPL